MNRKGCLIWGCSITLLLFLLIGGGTGIYIYYVYTTLRSYTDSKPMEIPVYKPDKEEIADIKAKTTELKNAIKNNREVEISFSGDELNTIVATNHDFDDIAGKVFFKIDDDKLSAQGSIPLSEVPGFRDRYLNGEFSLNATMKNGQVWVTVTKAVINGNPAPDDIMKELKSKNIIEGFYKDPKNAQMMKKFKRIEVKDGKLIIDTKGSLTTTPNNP